MRKLLVVYNTMGLSGVENIPYYVDSLRSLLSQTMAKSDDVKIVVSACCPTNMAMIQFQNTFGDLISYNFIHDNLPVSVTFNHSVGRCVEQFGEFEGYLYIDSGISFWDPSCRYDALQALWNVHKSGPYAITAAMPSNDDGRQWWGITYEPGVDYVFPVGKTTNMHAQIFSSDWKNAFKRILPDIFASHCMESVFSHMAASIHRKFIITQKVHLLHNHSMDGASIGSRQQDTDRTKMSSMFETGGLLFKTTKDIDQKYMEGVDLGFGIEECKEYWKHRPELFDENGYAKNPGLAPFMAKEMFLNDLEFSYSNIKSVFIGGR